MDNPQNERRTMNEKIVEVDRDTMTVNLVFPFINETLPQKCYSLQIRGVRYNVSVQQGKESRHYTLVLSREDAKRDLNIMVKYTERWWGSCEFSSVEEYAMPISTKTVILLEREIEVDMMLSIELSFWFLFGEDLRADDDAILVCDDEEFRVSKAVVSHWSPVIAELFMNHPDSNRVEVEACSAHELKSFLLFISSIFVNFIDCYGTVEAAQKLGCSLAIVNICEDVHLGYYKTFGSYSGMEIVEDTDEDWGEKMIALIWYGLSLSKLREFYKSDLDRFSEKTQQMWKDRKATLLAMKKDKEDEKEFEEKKKREERWEILKKRQENRKEKKKEKERKKDRKRRQKKRNA